MQCLERKLGCQLSLHTLPPFIKPIKTKYKMKNNIISCLLCVIAIFIFCVFNEHPILFMYICWLIGYSKNIFDIFKTN